MNPWPVDAEVQEVHLPRPGHADLAGIQKFGFSDVRNVLERASARETAARVACGAVAKGFLADFGVQVFSHVVQIGSVRAGTGDELEPGDFAAVDESPVRCLDGAASDAMVEEINTARKANESLGGVFEVRAYGLVPGVGSYLSWEGRMDGRLAQAIMSIQAMKGVSVGDAFDIAGRVGSQAHDEIFWTEERGFHRETNRSGGLGGRHDDRRDARRPRRDEAPANSDQAAPVGGHGEQGARAGAARADRLVHGPGRRRRRARRWSRSSSPMPTGRSSEATTSTTFAPRSPPTASGLGGSADRPGGGARRRGGVRLRRLHGRRQVHGRTHRGSGARGRSARLRPRA